MNEDVMSKEEEFDFLANDSGPLSAEEERWPALCRLYRQLAMGKGWPELLEALVETAAEPTGFKVETAAVVVWEGEEEFFHHVVWHGEEAPQKYSALDSALAREPDLLRGLARNQIAIRAGAKKSGEIYFPVLVEGEFLGACFVAVDEGSGPAEKSVESVEEIAQRLSRLFGAPAAELLRRYRLERDLRSSQEENRYFRERERQHYLFKDLVCESGAMRGLYDELNERGDDDDPLWLSGEGGTGKELLARALHHLGNRQEGMLIRLGCADFPAEFVEIELFGCVESELTGAVAPRKGIFELAEGGTVYLDEIDRLSMSVQGRLVRVLKENEVRRIGDAVGRSVDARFVVSSHRDLEELCGRGEFRRDLYELLKPHRLEVPALRERRKDILPLAQVFLEKFARRYGARCEGIEETLAEAMTEYDWPGNVRQLQTFMEAAVLMSRDEAVIKSTGLVL